MTTSGCAAKFNRFGHGLSFSPGELEPGKLIETSKFDEATKAKMLHGAALDWLGLEKDLFQ